MIGATMLSRSMRLSGWSSKGVAVYEFSEHLEAWRLLEQVGNRFSEFFCGGSVQEQYNGTSSIFRKGFDINLREHGSVRNSPAYHLGH